MSLPGALPLLMNNAAAMAALFEARKAVARTNSVCVLHVKNANQPVRSLCEEIMMIYTHSRALQGAHTSVNAAEVERLTLLSARRQFCIHYCERPNLSFSH